jgi:hypothetical protein
VWRLHLYTLFTHSVYTQTEPRTAWRGVCARAGDGRVFLCARVRVTVCGAESRMLQRRWWRTTDRRWNAGNLGVTRGGPDRGGPGRGGIEAAWIEAARVEAARVEARSCSGRRLYEASSKGRVAVS